LLLTITPATPSVRRGALGDWEGNQREIADSLKLHHSAPNRIPKERKKSMDKS
jgi:hypothetical protein